MGLRFEGKSSEEGVISTLYVLLDGRLGLRREGRVLDGRGWDVRRKMVILNVYGDNGLES